MLLADVRARLNRQQGQALVEYALILALVALALVGALGYVGGQIAGVFTTISNSL
jgi:Flp pilus assembly pilin Flp